MNERTCSVDGCDRSDHMSFGMCSMHYQRARAGRPLNPPPKSDSDRPTCSVDDCPNRDRLSLGMCEKHYARYRRNGAPVLQPPRTRVENCAVEGCERGGKMTSGLCGMHYSRLRTHGAPGSVDPVIATYAAGETCAIGGCGRGGPLKRGWCTLHYQRWAKYGAADREPPKAPDACTQDGCGRPHEARGLCGNHYMRVYRTGSVDGNPRIPRERLACMVDGCAEVDFTAGYCSMHYHRMRRHGDPLAPIRERVREHPDTCTVANCDAPYAGRGFCRMHYQEWNHQQNREARNARMRAHYEANREYYYTKTNARRSKLAKSSPEELVEAAEYRRAIAGDPCTYCGEPGRDVDHIFPVSKGGREVWFNLTMSCSRCNKSKAAHCGTWFRLRRRAGASADGLPAVVVEAG